MMLSYPLIIILAMVVYAAFAYIRHLFRADPKQEREALAEADRRLSEIEQAKALERGKDRNAP